MRSTRRAFLVKTTGLITFATSYPLAVQFLAERNMTTSLLSDSLSRLLQHPESARLIGTEYLRQNPGERNVRILTQKISGKATHYPKRNDQQRYRKDATSIGLQIRKDFERGYMTKVDGWYLSMTEARLCALFSMSFPGSIS